MIRSSKGNSKRYSFELTLYKLQSKYIPMDLVISHVNELSIFFIIEPFFFHILLVWLLLFWNEMNPETSYRLQIDWFSIIVKWTIKRTCFQIKIILKLVKCNRRWEFEAQHILNYSILFHFEIGLILEIELLRVLIETDLKRHIFFRLAEDGMIFTMWWNTIISGSYLKQK